MKSQEDKEFLTTLCLGWLGIHRFNQKKNVTGVIWLWTVGLFGIGWAVDTFKAYTKIRAKKGQQMLQHDTQSLINEQIFEYERAQNTKKQIIKSFDTVIVGTFAKCSLNPDEKHETMLTKHHIEKELEIMTRILGQR